MTSGSEGAPAPGRRVSTAQTRSPRSASGRPSTATSATAGCWISSVSSSSGAIFSPLRMIRSLVLPVTSTCPSGRRWPRSPVRNQPSAVNACASSDGSVYPWQTAAPRTWISPSAPVGSTTASSTIRTSLPGIGLPSEFASCSSVSSGEATQIIGTSVMP